ncbi:hypothetical protein PPROV_000012200 [Pycnococcus provasolii]|uniref:Uncharacterized protein n=1 Tax=Pycnococcus provasolii TaxID=41880 RepID=A0A830H2K0_9CHLO|nr:hypothetical protein PPROV_000012200 [Pycnococcus provasolii]
MAVEVAVTVKVAMAVEVPVAIAVEVAMAVEVKMEVAVAMAVERAACSAYDPYVGAFHGLVPFAVRTKGDVVHAPAPLVAPDTGDVFDAVEVHSAASHGLAFLAPAAPPTISGAFDAAAMPTPPEAQAGAPPAYAVSAAARANLASARIVAHAHCGRGTTRADAHAVALVPGKGLRLLHITSTLNAEDALGDSAPVHATDVGSATPEPRHAA